MGKWLSSPEHILFDVAEGVATITINRPEKRNAIAVQTLEELRAALMEADDLQAVRVVILRGAGGNFSAGADIGDSRSGDYDLSLYRGSTSFEDDIWQTTVRSELRLILFKMHKPVIARIDGYCLAASTDVALNCDLLIAADDALIGFPATRALGSPANHMWLYHVGPQWAKRMLLTGDLLRGKDAEKIGLVLKSVPADRLDEEVAELARRIALLPSDLAAAHKRIVNAGMELMGWHVLQRMASENDSRAHQSPALAEFLHTAKTKGLKEAVRRRDEPFGNSIIHFDD